MGRVGMLAAHTRPRASTQTLYTSNRIGGGRNRCPNRAGIRLKASGELQGTQAASVAAAVEPGWGNRPRLTIDPWVSTPLANGTRRVL